MKTASEFQNVRIENGKLVINQFQTADQDIVNYFEAIEPDKRQERLVNALKIGVVAIQTISKTDNIHYVEKVIGRLDHDLRNQMMELQQEFRIKKTKDELINKTTLKGKSFEDRCESIIGEGARVFGDLLENTTTKEGKLKDSKKGDFVVNQKEINKRIVFEVKDVSTISAYQIQRILQESIENRDASYGILVVKSVESLPKSIGWFQEIGHNMLVCALSTLEKDEDTLHAELLLIGYKWARLRIMLQNFRENKIDAEFIQDKISRIQHKISELRTIKIQCRNIETASDKIRTVSKQLEDDIGRELSEILGSIASK